MILCELSRYLAERRRAALADLAHRFDTDPETLRHMLATLERKGRVRHLPPVSLCDSGCGKCGRGMIELYEWTGSERTVEAGAIGPGSVEAQRCAAASAGRRDRRSD